MKFSFLVTQPLPHLSEVARRMERIAELGYAGIELVAMHPWGYPIQDLESVSRRLRLPVVSLLSGWSYSNEGLCLASPDDALRERAAARLTDYVESAAELGALLVVGLMQGLRADEPDSAKANDRIATALSRVARVAQQRGVQLVIEPVNHLQVGFNHTAAEVASLVDRIGSPAATLMLDTLHMHLEERSPIDTIRTYAGRIGHFHLCESNGGPFGSGNLDFDSVLRALKAAGYDKYVSIKIYRNASWDEAARSAMEFLRSLNSQAEE